MRLPTIVGDPTTGFSIESASGVDEHPTGEVFFDDDTRTPEVRSRRRSSAGDIEIPVLEAAEKAAMDSLKYRLPDHINGNGTKSTPDVRKAHIERDDRNDDSTPPTPVSKDDTPDGSTPNDVIDVQSYFNPFGLQRSGSIYTLSRVSFANQLAQLTSLQLPDAESLSSKVAAIPTAQAASRALMGAADQIRSWISKASEVLGGLDADDDVEWAAADGREGLAEVDNAITRFEELINVYVSAIDGLQNREDITNVPSQDLSNVLTQVETILSEWEKIKKNLTGVKGQVEIAMEWEELWNTVLGDIGNEMEILKKLVFEMEEKRHKSLALEAGGDGVDIGELETIVEETPQVDTRMQSRNNRFSVQAGFPMSPSSPQTPTMAQDDSSLLALFARMQPLRASLDFLPMRLSTFHYRAEKTFPTACNELETRRDGLESGWKQLEKDAESLRRELGEDRWVIVFRGAGRQAQKMYESVERSVEKLKETVDAGGHLNNPSAMGKKIEAYETKKLHYGPAIERVLAIIERGVKDRLTVNGEIVRLHSDMQSKWGNLRSTMADLDIVLDDLQADKRNQQLRDSISSLMSNDRSTVGSLDTPGSSPASSVIMSSINGTLDQTPIKNGKLRSASKPAAPGARRSISTPSQLPRKGLTSRLSSYGISASAGTGSPPGRGGSATPTGNRLPRPSAAGPDGKPRWNSSVKTDPAITGHNFQPLTLTTPSPYAKTGPPSAHQNRSYSAFSTPLSSKIPLRSPLGADSPSSPASGGETTPSRPAVPRNTSSRLAFRDRIASPGPYSQFTLASSSPATRPRQLQSQASAGNLSNRRASYQPVSSAGNSTPVRPSISGRPASSLAMSSTAGKRTSLLPQPRGRKDSSVTGRESPAAVAGAQSAMRRNSSQTSTDSKGREKAKWK